MMLYGMEHPFGEFGSAVIVVSPLNLHVLNVLSSGTEWEKEKTLMLCKCCSVIVKTLMCYQHSLRHKSKTYHHMGCYEEN